METVSPDKLKSRNLCVNLVLACRSEWKNRTVFNKFLKTRRPYSGLFFVLSDVKSTFIQTDKNGREIRRISAKNGDILYLPENVFYHTLYQPDPAAVPAVTYTLNFDLYDENSRKILLDESFLLLNNPVNKSIREELKAIYESAKNPLLFDRLRISSLFFSILYNATSPLVADTPGGYIRKALTALEDDWNRNEKIERYAALCRMSTAYFYRDFRALTGMTPTQFRNQIRINIAKNDLLNTGMTVKEIAEKVGFDDTFYFSRLFRKITGQSPKQFRDGKPSDK